MKVYDPTIPLISLHIPKTGGTSFLNVLEDWFPNGDLLLHYRNGNDLPEQRILKGSMCIHGHFNSARGLGSLQYYPHINQYITFLRDPFDLFLSQWFFLNKLHQSSEIKLKNSQLSDSPSFSTWLLRRADEQIRVCNTYSFLWHMPFSFNSSKLDEELHQNFVFIGIMERYQPSVSALSQVLNKPNITVPHFNITERDHDFSQYRSLYEKCFADEYELYEKALAINMSF